MQIGPGQQLAVSCQLAGRGAPAEHTQFVPAQTRVHKLDAQDALYEFDADGRATVILTNNNKFPMEFDKEEVIVDIQWVDPAECKTVHDVQNDGNAMAILPLLSSGDKELLARVLELEGECRFLRGGDGTGDTAQAGGATADGPGLDDGGAGPPGAENKGECHSSRASDGGSLGHGQTQMRRQQPVFSREPKALPPLHGASFEQWLSNHAEPKWTIMSLDPSVFERSDVLARVTLYAGMGGVDTGAVVQYEGKYVVTALAIEAEAEECHTHRLNNPCVPVLQMRMVSHQQVEKALVQYLPRRFWRHAWVHASNSCKKASASNMFQRDIAAARADTAWAIGLLEKLRVAVWTLENVATLHQFFKGRYPTAHIFHMHQHCKLAQDRKRLVISNRALFLPRVTEDYSVRQCLGGRKGWDANKRYWTRSAWGVTRDVNQRSPTVTSGHLQAGAEDVGDFGPEHTLDSVDRSLLQGFDSPPMWSADLSESDRRRMVAQCVPPPFARVLSKAAFEYQQQAKMLTETRARMALLQELPEAEVAAYVADGMPLSDEWMGKAAAARVEALTEEIRCAANADEEASVKRAAASPELVNEQHPAGTVLRLGKHGRWRSEGEYGWTKASISTRLHRESIEAQPWLKCEKPPQPNEDFTQFRRRREREKLQSIHRFLEQAEMQHEDKDVVSGRAGGKQEAGSSVASRASRHFTNVSSAPDMLQKHDANAEKQVTEPQWYGPYLKEGERYKNPRTEENWRKACQELGLDDLAEEEAGERKFYADLVWELWILFDGQLRPISGVEVDLDLSGVKPIRAHPYRWSPAKVEAGRKLIAEFIEDGILKPVTSEWASPALIVPKPKGGWRLVVDLRELNKLIPHDTYEPPSCDLCLEWLAGKKYRTTADLRWGFHQVLLSERTQKIFTLVTPFGSFAYRRLVMGYINATAEFQRHVNNTLGPSLWDCCLAMVDDLVIGSETLPEHRVHVTSVLTKLAQRQHSIKPSKMGILKRVIEYLGHLSTPTGTLPTGKHVEAVVSMPVPLVEGHEAEGLVDKLRLRSYLGLVKFLRRYIADCGRICEPLNRVAQETSEERWGPMQQMVFDRLKREVAFSKGVCHANPKLPFYVCSDGSKRGIGGYLFQKVDGEEKIIAYFSRTTTKDERKWDTRELEVLALICTLEYFRHYIDGQRLVLQTDHRNITWLSNLKGHTGRLGRWVLRLSEFPHTLEYRKGKFMHVADCLSRNSQQHGPDPYDGGIHSDASGVMPAASCLVGEPVMVIEELNPQDARSGVREDGSDRVSAVHRVDIWVPEREEQELFECMQEASDEHARRAQHNAHTDGDATGVSNLFSGEGTQASAQPAAPTPDEVADADPLQVPESTAPRPVQLDEIRAAQREDEFAKHLLTQLQGKQPGEVTSTRANKFTVLNGILYRVTEADDPREGYDSARPYIPPKLRNQIVALHHNSVWGCHRNETATFKDVVNMYYWPDMHITVKEFVKNCRICELAKGTKPSRQGFLQGWKHNSVNKMITMDLVGPIGATETGHVAHKKPLYILVITDPFSHMLWLLPITGKSAEEVYQQFVTGYLLEEGAPQFVLTDRGGEFKNDLLAELMRLLKVRLQFTPSYHPRGNYTERVNRFIGESLRCMLNSPGAKKQDWWKLTKFVQFAYRRMLIPGTNVSPYMVARGRQPSLPTLLELQQLGDALPALPSLGEHVKRMAVHLRLAQQLLLAARGKVLAASRERFNEHQVEVVFQPDERVRLWKRVPVRLKADSEEISTKLKLFNAEYVVIAREGQDSTMYRIRDVATGKETSAHVSQMARMRSEPEEDSPADAQQPGDEAEDKLYDRLQPGRFALIRRKEDSHSILMVVEVLDVNDRDFVGWYYIHGGGHHRGRYNHERPLGQRQLIPEWVNKKTGQIERPSTLEAKAKCRKILGDFAYGDVELIATGWHMQKGGKIPQPVIDKGDAYLRRHMQVEPRVVVALSKPNEQEKKRAAQMLAVWVSANRRAETTDKPTRAGCEGGLPVVQALTPH